MRGWCWRSTVSSSWSRNNVNNQGKQDHEDADEYVIAVAAGVAIDAIGPDPCPRHENGSRELSIEKKKGVLRQFFDFVVPV